MTAGVDIMQEVHALLRVNDDIGALRLLKRIVRQGDPAHGDYALAGSCAFRLWENTFAVECFSKAAKLEPNIAKYWCDLANVLARLNRHTEAVQAFNKCLAIKPDDELANVSIALSLCQLNKVGEALAHFKRSPFSLTEPYFATYLDALLSVGESGAAVELICSQIPTFKSNPAWRQSIQALLVRATMQAAEHVLLDTVVMSVDGLVKLDDTVSAEMFCQFLREVAPDYQPGVDSYATLLKQQGRSDEGKRLWADYCLSLPMNYAAKIGYARYLAAVKHRHEAKQTLADVLQILPDEDVVARRDLAAAHEYIGDFVTAIEHLRVLPQAVHTAKARPEMPQGWAWVNDRNLSELERTGPHEDLVLVQHHLCNTGGDAFASVFAQLGKFKLQRSYEQTYPGMAAEYEVLSKIALPHRLLLYSHGWHGVHRVLNSPSCYFSILRAPDERLISDFSWCNRHRADLMASPDALKEALCLYIDSLEHANYQVYEFALEFSERATDNPHLSPQVLAQMSVADAYARAEASIAENFMFVGITEMFEESLFMLFHLLGLPELPPWRMFDAHAPGRGRSSSKLRAADLPQATRQRLEQILEADWRLYRKVKSQLEARLSECDFGEELQRYKAQFQ